MLELVEALNAASRVNGGFPGQSASTYVDANDRRENSKYLYWEETPADDRIAAASGQQPQRSATTRLGDSQLRAPRFRRNLSSFRYLPSRG